MSARPDAFAAVAVRVSALLTGATPVGWRAGAERGSSNGVARRAKVSDMDWRERIVSDPAICHGKPTVKGTRVLVSVLLSHLAHGDRVDTILEQFPSLSADDVRAVIAFAAQAAAEDLPAPPPRAAGAGR
jgi:uncharacterized protein (DUF433 family)